MQDKITNAKVNSKPTKAKAKTTSRSHVSEQDNCKGGRSQTCKVINDIASTLIQLEEMHMHENGQKPAQPCTAQAGSRVSAHDGCIMQGLADGNI